jgi:hypothetical protein
MDFEPIDEWISPLLESPVKIAKFLSPSSFRTAICIADDDTNCVKIIDQDGRPMSTIPTGDTVFDLTAVSVPTPAAQSDELLNGATSDPETLNSEILDGVTSQPKPGILVSTRNRPIHLIHPFSTSILASYTAYSCTEEIVHAYSIQADGRSSTLIGGFPSSTVRIWDMNTNETMYSGDFR